MRSAYRARDRDLGISGGWCFADHGRVRPRRPCEWEPGHQPPLAAQPRLVSTPSGPSSHPCRPAGSASRPGRSISALRGSLTRAPGSRERRLGKACDSGGGCRTSAQLDVLLGALAQPGHVALDLASLDVCCRLHTPLPGEPGCPVWSGPIRGHRLLCIPGPSPAAGLRNIRQIQRSEWHSDPGF